VKIQRLGKLIDELKVTGTGKGLTVNAKIEQSIGKRYVVSVVIARNEKKLVDYYTTNLDEARETMKNFLSLLSVVN